MFLALFLLLLVTDPRQAVSLLQEGLRALQHGELTQAKEALEQASRLDPNNAYAWASLAETYRRLKNPQQASAAAQTAENVGSEDPVVTHALAIFYTESGDPARAFAFAQTAEKQQSSPANRDLLAQTAFNYAQVLFRKQDFTRAADTLSSAIQSNPGNTQLTLALGVARYGQRRFEDSVLQFLKVIQIDPAIEQPYVFLGRMLDQAGTHLGQITSAYETWVSRAPHNAKAQLLLAKALLASDAQSEKAEALLRRSIALNPNDWEAHYELGVLLANKHQYPQAAVELTRSVEIEPNQPEPHYHLARVYDRLGQPDRAKAERALHERLTAATPH
ncbi:MAG: tetratricopeptide repeat protein [Bryobacteraceae bacterium]